MFGRKKGPDEPFQHAEDCKIVHADPGVRIRGPRSAVESGRLAVCAASSSSTTPSLTIVCRSTRSTRIPLAHSPLCEFVSATDPSVLRAVRPERPSLLAVDQEGDRAALRMASSGSRAAPTLCSASKPYDKDYADGQQGACEPERDECLAPVRAVADRLDDPDADAPRVERANERGEASKAERAESRRPGEGAPKRVATGRLPAHGSMMRVAARPVNARPSRSIPTRTARSVGPPRGRSAARRNAEDERAGPIPRVMSSLQPGTGSYFVAQIRTITEGGIAKL